MISIIHDRSHGSQVSPISRESPIREKTIVMMRDLLDIEIWAVCFMILFLLFRFFGFLIGFSFLIEVLLFFLFWADLFSIFRVIIELILIFIDTLS